LQQVNNDLNFDLEEARKETKQTKKTVESMKTKQQVLEKKTKNKEDIIDENTKMVEEMTSKNNVMLMEWNASKQKNEELEKKVNSMKTEIAALRLKAKTTVTDKTERKVKLETKLHSLEDELDENRNTLKDVFQAKSELEYLNGNLVRENESLKEETEMLKSKFLELEQIKEQLRKEHLQSVQKHKQQKEDQCSDLDTLQQKVKRLQSNMERNRHEVKAERQHNSKLQSKLQTQTTQLESEREYSNKMRSELEKLENKYAALIAERKASEFKANASEEKLKRNFSEAKRLEEHLKDDLKRIRAERNILQIKLAEAEHTVSEYHRKETDIRGSLGGEIEDNNSEIYRLKQEHETTKRELDNTNIRYGLCRILLLSIKHYLV